MDRKPIQITIKSVAALEKNGGRITDASVPGFVARRLDSGRVQFGLAYGTREQRRWITLGLLGEISVDEARRKAEKFRGQVRDDRDPVAERKKARDRETNTVNHVLDQYLELNVRAEKKLRSADRIEQDLKNHVRDAIGGKCIYNDERANDLTRADIAKIKNGLIKQGYARQAHKVLGHLRSAFNWWATQDERFVSPIVRGMVEDENQIRTRILSPDEIRDLWRALDELVHVPQNLGAYVKVLLLTGLRRSELAGMHTDEIDDDTWTIPAARMKGGLPHVVPLIPAIKKLLPKTIKNGFVFGCASHRHHQAAGAAPPKGWGKLKTQIDDAIADLRKREKRPAMEPWTFHDLRRTARTMLEELGIRDRVAEAILAHAKHGIRKVYNQYQYLPEKTDALNKLAVHIDRITSLPRGFDKTRTKAPPAATKLRLVAGR